MPTKLKKKSIAATRKKRPARKARRPKNIRTKKKSPAKTKAKRQPNRKAAATAKAKPKAIKRRAPASKKAITKAKRQASATAKTKTSAKKKAAPGKKAPAKKKPVPRGTRHIADPAALNVELGPLRDRLLPMQAICDLLGMTRKAVQDSQAISPASTSGRYRVYQEHITVLNYIDSLRSGLVGDTVASSRISLQKEQQRKLEIMNDLAEGKTVLATEIYGQILAWSATIRQGLNALPGRLAQQIAGMSDAGAIMRLIQSEHDELFDLAAATLDDQLRDSGPGAGSGNTNGDRPRPAKHRTAAKKVPRRVGERKKSTATRKR